MKKGILLHLVLLVSMTYTVSAQWSIGARGGPNLANANVFLPYTTRANTGLLIGGVVSYRLNDWASVELQPQYAQKGITLGYPFFAPDAEWATPAFSYIEFPMVLKIETKLGNFSGFAFGGINPAILLSGKLNVQQWDNDGKDLKTIETRDLRDRMLPYDLAFDYGVGISYEMVHGIKLVGDARQSVGLVKVMKNEPGDPNWFFSSNYSYKSLDIKFMGGVMFDL